MSKDLDTFIRENRKFLKIKSGESFTGIYKGYAVVPDPFSPDGKEKVAYRFQDLSDKVVRSWTCGQAKVAEDMKKIMADEIVKVTRAGATAKDTSYKIEVQAPF